MSAPAMEAVIGLEVHAELLTKSKIFCACSAAFGAAPNTNVCPLCLGMPGLLPVLNRTVVEFAVMFGYALVGFKTTQFAASSMRRWMERGCGGALLVSAASLALVKRVNG